MDKQTTLAFVMIGIILVAWLYFNAPEPQPQQPKTSDEPAMVDDQSESIESEAKETTEPEGKIATAFEKR